MVYMSAALRLRWMNDCQGLRLQVINERGEWQDVPAYDEVYQEGREPLTGFRLQAPIEHEAPER